MADFYVLAYDITDNKRRNRLVKVLQSYGERVQFSVFEFYLTDVQLKKVKANVMKIIHPEKDKIRLYSLCCTCLKGCMD